MCTLTVSVHEISIFVKQNKQIISQQVENKNPLILKLVDLNPKPRFHHLNSFFHSRE